MELVEEECHGVASPHCFIVVLTGGENGQTAPSPPYRGRRILIYILDFRRRTSLFSSSISPPPPTSASASPKPLIRRNPRPTPPPALPLFPRSRRFVASIRSHPYPILLLSNLPLDFPTGVSRICAAFARSRALERKAPFPGSVMGSPVQTRRPAKRRVAEESQGGKVALDFDLNNSPDEVNWNETELNQNGSPDGGTESIDIIHIDSETHSASTGMMNGISAGINKQEPVEEDGTGMMNGISAGIKKQEPVENQDESWLPAYDWFTCLSDSELDLLVSLKELVIKRAKSKGCQDCIRRINLDTLRGLGVILLEDLKGRMRNKSIFQNSSGGINPLDTLELMKSDEARRSGSTGFFDSNMSEFSTLRRKCRADRYPEEGCAINKKTKVEYE